MSISQWSPATPIMVEQCIKAGGTGIAIAIGRNVVQQPNPLQTLKRLHAILHRGANARDALALGKWHG